MDEVQKRISLKMQKSIHALQDNFNSIRTGRASSALFEKIKVEYYDQQVPLNQVATISIPEARLVVIQPWDRTVLGDVEKAIQKSDLSVNPNNDGKVIRINIPPLTEERRQEFVKLARGKAEQARVSIRNIRREANEELKSMQKSGKISEDDSKRGIDETQKSTDEYIAQISSLLEEKEKEILEF